jgi:hypothetical protein
VPKITLSAADLNKKKQSARQGGATWRRGGEPMEEAGVVEVDWWRRMSGAGAGGGVGHQSRRQAGRWSRPVELAERH